MSSLPLKRTEYWNLSTNTVRGGATGHGESLTDMEDYLLPLAQTGASSFYTWGVVDGLTVKATLDQPDVTISPGVALDAAGHIISLAVNGFAIVDPAVDPNQAQNIPTVPVGANGLTLSTAGVTGDCVLTLTWREVFEDSQIGSAPVLIHAPWLRLLDVTGFHDDGEQVILAQATLGSNGLVTTLSAAGRRLAGLPAGRLELRRLRAVGGPQLRVDHLPAAEFQARDDGGLEINLLPPGGPARPALSVDAATGNVGIATAAPKTTLDVTGSATITGGLTVSGGVDIDQGATDDPALRLVSSGPGWGSGLVFSNAAAGAKTYGAYAGADGKWHFADRDSQVDRLVIDQSGNLGIGVAVPRAPLHLPAAGLQIGTRAARVDGAFHLSADSAAGLPGLRLYNGDYGTGAHLLTITATGNVGIATPTPKTTLDVTGSATITGGLTVTGALTGNGQLLASDEIVLNGGAHLNGSTLYVRQGTGDKFHGLRWNGSADGSFPGAPDGPVLFGFHGGALASEQFGGVRNVALSWDDSNNVTVNGALTVNNDLHLEKGGGDWAFINQDNYPVAFGSKDQAHATEPDYHFWVRHNMGVQGWIRAFDYQRYSDMRQKTEISLLEAVLDRLQALRGIRYRWRQSDGTAVGEPQIGVIAQEVRSVFPELVSGRESDGLLTVSYDGLTAVLVEAVKHLHRQVAVLERGVERLTPANGGTGRADPEYDSSATT
jgi:phage baseplate assembly protein gpV